MGCPEASTNSTRTGVRPRLANEARWRRPGSEAQARVSASGRVAWLITFINEAGSGAGLSHKLGKAIGATWDIPHGVTSAITLPAVLRFEAQRRPQRVALVAQALGVDDAARGVIDLVERVGLERKALGSFGIRADDVPGIVTYALGREDADVAAVVTALL